MISLTQSASNHIETFLKKRGSGIGIKIGVRTSGCSGLAYTIEYVDEINKEDNVFENFGVKVFVDSKSLEFLSGTELNYIRNGLSEGFEFNNPNVKNACGCGESFNV